MEFYFQFKVSTKHFQDIAYVQQIIIKNGTELKDITLALKIRFNKEFTDINLCAHFLLDLEQLLQVLYLSVTVIWQKRKKNRYYRLTSDTRHEC